MTIQGGVMNWLLYIGGGYLFVAISWGFLERGSAKNIFIPISALSVWVWLCWRFVN